MSAGSLGLTEPQGTAGPPVGPGWRAGADARRTVTQMEIHELPALELGRRMAAGQVSPVEVVDAVLDRIDRLDGRLHAFTTTTAGRARDEAERAEVELAAGSVRGPLHGVPYAVKDLFDVAGERTGAGTSVRDDHRAIEDCRAVRSATEAGMVLVGKTHTVQFAYGGVGINHDTGTPHNPRFEEPHAPGGSSSGAGVAVAAHLVPVALGTDTGGSVRIPASLCGIVGLKTTVGRVSRTGVYPLSDTLDSVGPLAREVADLAAMYDVLQGPDPDDRSTLCVAREPVADRLASGVDGLRLAFGEGLMFEDVDPEVEAAVRATAEVFAGIGAPVGACAVPEAETVTRGEVGTLLNQLLAVEAYSVNREYVDEHFDDLDPIVATRMIVGRDIPAVEYLRAQREMAVARRSFLARMADVDALLVPTTARPAHAVAEIDATPDRYFEFNAAYLRNTAVGNRLGLCGVSVPCGTTRSGAPIGLMILAAPFREDVALRVASAFEAAR